MGGEIGRCVFADHSHRQFRPSFKWNIVCLFFHRLGRPARDMLLGGGQRRRSLSSCSSMFHLDGERLVAIYVVRKLEADVVSPGEERRMIPNNAC